MQGLVLSCMMIFHYNYNSNIIYDIFYIIYSGRRHQIISTYAESLITIFIR